MVSIIIASMREEYLDKTIEDLRTKARGEIEIIVIQDKPMRTAINEGVIQAKGKYILKTDAHCMFDEGFDIKLVEVHQPNWVQTPRRKRLDADKWELTQIDQPDIDYMFIYRGKGFKDHDKNRDEKLKKKLIDDVQIFQGSCWFMEKVYFQHLGLLDDINFGGMGSEALEICLKTRADGGRVIVNKTTWYAHYHKTKAVFRRNMDKSLAYLPNFLKQYDKFI
jgi:glycosyltransferase involved in cell wall biosynthesis